MESTKNRKKGLLSIVSLIVCLAMLTVGTYAWFTDTATVGGNKVMAGNLDVAIVMKGSDLVEKYDKIMGTSLASGDFTIAIEEIKEDEDGPFYGVKVAKTGESDSASAYYDVSGMKANIITLGNMEPGQVYPIVFDVYNKGELAIGFTAGFKLPKRLDASGNPVDGTATSYTGLEALKLQVNNELGTFKANPASGNLGAGSDYTAPTPEAAPQSFDDYKYRLRKLVDKQWAVEIDDADLAGFDFDAAGGTNDKGGHLEDVLEVYTMSMDEYNAQFVNNSNSWKADTADLFTKKTPAVVAADGTVVTPEKKNEHFIGTIADIVNSSNDAYKTQLDNDITSAQTAITNYEAQYAIDHPDTPIPADDIPYNNLLKAKKKLVDEKERLANAEDKLRTSSSGYCVPTNAMSGMTADSTGKINVTLKSLDGSQTKTIKDVSDFGNAVYLIKMSEDAGDIYQNAYIELDMGVTANQVKWDRDGVNNYLYDPTPVPPTTTPNPNPDPTPAPAP